jgi:hypothetical protein
MLRHASMACFSFRLKKQKNKKGGATSPCSTTVRSRAVTETRWGAFARDYGADVKAEDAEEGRERSERRVAYA